MSLTTQEQIQFIVTDAPVGTPEDPLVRMQEDLRRAIKKPENQRHWVMALDLRKCVGCSACTVACVVENKLPPGVVYRPVLEEELGTYPNVTRRFVPRPCMLAQRQGKLIELDLQGNDLQLDRSAMQKLAEPIRRLVWFAAAHSIENVERRRTAGKPTAGRVTVHVSAREDHAQVVIVDDGQGIDRALIAQRARELGWRDLAEESLDAILRPGFGSIGGNEASAGIDFAAMNAELRAHQGRLSVISDAGHSTRFEIYLPLDLAVMDGVVVRVGAVRYVVPVNAIQKIVAAEPMHIVHSSAGGNYSMLRFEDGLVQIRTLGKNGSTADPARSFDGKLFVIVEGKQSRLALTIDELFERHQVLVRPLGQWSETQDAVGCALLGEGEVGVVLNLN